MFGFLIKKTFFDMWDNLFRILLLNLGFIVITAIFLLLPLLSGIPALMITVLVIGVALFTVYTGAASKMCAEIADYKQPGFSDFFSFVKRSLVPSLLIALAAAAYVLIVVIAFRFYGNMKSMVGTLAAALLFWITIAIVLSLQFFFPIQSRLDNKFAKTLKKSFLVFLDNPGFTIALFLSSLLIMGVSVFTALLLPGIASLLLWWNNAFKLRLYKYDWLEKNPQGNRRHIPWDALLVEDRERVGKRTLKGMIFPWKE